MAANLAHQRPVLLLARLGGWGLMAIMILALLLAGQWLGRWYVGRDAELQAKVRAHNQAVLACVRTHSLMTQTDCDGLVREAEAARGD
jgi:hypothetical protein